MLRECVNLRTLDVDFGPEVTGLREVAALTRLEKLSITASSSPEPWGDLLGTTATEVTVHPVEGLSLEDSAPMLARGWRASSPRDF